MKRIHHFISFVLLLSFLSSSIGVSVYKHYCGDFLAAVSLYVESNPCADENGGDICSSNKATSCCDDETDYYQLDTDLVVAVSKKLQIILPFTFQRTEIKIIDEDLTSEESQFTGNNSPTIFTIPIYKKQKQLIFYA